MRGSIASRGIDAYLPDFAAVVSFGLNGLCTPDSDLLRRLIAGPPSPSVNALPAMFVPTTFAPHPLPYSSAQTEYFVEFVAQLMGLKRKVFRKAMRAIRKYVTGLHRLSDDLDAAYTLLVSSLEPLLEGNDPIKHRYYNFVEEHVARSFYREGAFGVISPVGRAELAQCLDHAYTLRSRYLHGSKGLPRILKYGRVSKGETVPTSVGTALTFNGLVRLLRHVISQFILRQDIVEQDPCDYSRDEPGVILAPLAPKHWVASPVNKIDAKTGRKRLFAFSSVVAENLQSSEPCGIPDMKDMLEQVHGRLGSVPQHDRLPFVVLQFLHDLVVHKEARVYESRAILRQFEEDFRQLTIETMLLMLFFKVAAPWDCDAQKETLEEYLKGRERDQGVKMDELFEAGLTLDLAECFRSEGEIEKAEALISMAVENHPGKLSLVEFERNFNPCEKIDWRGVMSLTERLDTSLPDEA